MQSQPQPQPEETVIQPRPLPKLSTAETAAIWADYPSIEHLEAGNVGPWLNERQSQLQVRAQDERTGMNLAKLVCLAGGAAGAVLYASNPLAVIGGMVAGAGYVWSVVQDLACTHQFAPIPFVRGSLLEFLSSMGEAGAREEYMQNQNELADLMLHLPPMERYELAMLYSHTHTLSLYLSHVGEGKRFYAYRWLLGWYVQLEGHFPQQADLTSHLNDIKADPRVDYGAVTALQNYQKNLENQLPPPPAIPQLADSTVSLGELAAPQSLQAWLSGETPKQGTETTIDVTPAKEGEQPTATTTYHSDPLINQCIEVILGCLKNKGAECTFLEVVDCPKFWRILLRKTAKASVAVIDKAGEDLFCELGTVITDIKTSPIVSAKIKGGKIGIDIPKPKDKWNTVYFRDYISPDARSFESPLLIPIGIDMDGRLVEADLEVILGLLVAGATGSGKSIFATGSISSLICRYTPESLRLVLSDTKRVEFRSFMDIPHLLYPVAEDINDTVQVLQNVCIERDRREKLFANLKARNLAQYNSKVPPQQRLPRILVWIEETANCALSEDYFYEEDGSDKPPKVFYKDRFNNSKDEIKRLARAAGIYLVDSTQSPRVDVLPGRYRGQHITFLCFAVSRPEESEIALAGQTKEGVNLLREGDALYLDGQGMQRIQSLFIEPDEVDSIVAKVIDTYGSRDEYAMNQVIKRLEGALGQPDTGELPDRVSEEQSFRGTELQGFGGTELQETPPETHDSYRDYEQIRKLRNAVPPVHKKEIIGKHWGYHSSQYEKGNQRYCEALAEHAQEWVLELHSKNASPGAIANRIWGVRRNDVAMYSNVLALIDEFISNADSHDS